MSDPRAEQARQAKEYIRAFLNDRWETCHFNRIGGPAFEALVDGIYVHYALPHAHAIAAALAAAEGRVNQQMREALEKCVEACEVGRLHLVNDLVEPGRTVFWKLVFARDKAQQALAAAPPEGAHEQDGMTWTDKRPTEPGWYWVTRGEGSLDCVEVKADPVKAGRLFIRTRIDEDDSWLDEFTARQWSSHPLVPPTGGG